MRVHGPRPLQPYIRVLIHTDGANQRGRVARLRIPLAEWQQDRQAAAEALMREVDDAAGALAREAERAAEKEGR